MQKSMLYGDTDRPNTIYSMLSNEKGVFFMLQVLGFLNVIKSYVIAVYTGLPAVEWLGLFLARHTAQSLQYLSRMA